MREEGLALAGESHGHALTQTFNALQMPPQTHDECKHDTDTRALSFVIAAGEKMETPPSWVKRLRMASKWKRAAGRVHSGEREEFNRKEETSFPAKTQR